MQLSKLQQVMLDPHAVPPSLRAIHDQVLAGLEQIARSNDRAATTKPVDSLGTFRQTFAHLSASDSENTVCILGGRGSGKSTALHYICAALLDKSEDIVLPIIQPERFSNGDTLTGWVLAQLSELGTVTDSTFLDRELTLPGGETTALTDLLGRMKRQQAVIRGGYSGSLAPHSLAPEQFGRDVAMVPHMGVEFFSNWTTLISAVLAKPDTGDAPHRRPLLVIPVDDADLAVELLPSLLQEVRTLSAHPSVAMILCADWRTLNIALLNDLILNRVPHSSELINLGLLSPSELKRHVDTQLTKTLPRQYRAQIPALSADQRLRFQPLTHTGSLLELLNMFKVSPFVDCINTLGDLFSLGQRMGRTGLHASGYASCLPPNARELEQLYLALDQHRERTEQLKTEPIVVARLAAKILLDYVLAYVEVMVPTSANRPVTLELDGDDVVVTLDYTTTHLGAAVGRGARIYAITEPLRLEVAVRRIDTVRKASSRAGDSSENSEDTTAADNNDSSSKRDVRPELIDDLPEELVSSVLLCGELIAPGSAGRGLLAHGGFYGQLAYPGGSSWIGVQISVDGSQMQTSIWTVPDWEGFYDYFLYIEAWNYLTASVLSLRRITLSDSRLMQFFLATHLEIVVAIHRWRSIDPSIWRVTSADLERMLSGPEDEWISEIEERLARFGEVAAIAYGELGRSTRDGDFRRWIELELPRLFCSELLPSTFVDRLVAIRQTLLGDNRTTADRNAVVAIQRLVRTDYHQAGATLLVSALSRLSPESGEVLQAELAISHHARAADADRLVQLLMEKGVPSEIIDDLRTNGFSRELHASLAGVGLNTKAIAALASMYPARMASADG